MRAFQADLESFERLDTQVLGVSPDSIGTHERFARENGLAFPLVSDPKGAVASLYGRGRITVLIDRRGIVRFIQEGLPNTKDFLAKIRGLAKER